MPVWDTKLGEFYVFHKFYYQIENKTNYNGKTLAFRFFYQCAKKPTGIEISS